MNHTLVESKPSVMMGKPVIAGTRITVELILTKLATGETLSRFFRLTLTLQKKGY